MEYNLLYDAGTKFGLNTPGARIESIFMSLPPIVHFDYFFTPEKDSEEEITLNLLKNPITWVWIMIINLNLFIMHMKQKQEITRREKGNLLKKGFNVYNSGANNQQDPLP